MSYQTEYQRSLLDPEGFWREKGAEIAWFKPPTEVLSQDAEGFYRWFRGGQLNSAYLALDVHVEQGRGSQAALIYDSPVTGSQAVYTYRELRDEVARFAGALARLGVGRGDTVLIYMPMIPQALVGMLACARLGAIHSVVFGGFAAHELAVRIDDARPLALLTASCGKEPNRLIDYLAIVEAACQEAEHKIPRRIVYQRSIGRGRWAPGAFLDWDEEAAAATPAGPVAVDATDPLYILYTSGTTGKPKGIIRDHGGHAVALHYSMSSIYDASPGEVFWAASDIGWVVGHSYIVYGPLFYGCTTLLYEGKPVRTPDAGAFWRVAEEHGVRVMFTAPTSLRAIRREDPSGLLLKRRNLTALKSLFLAGERCDVPTLRWAQAQLNVPVIDHWWQTESGWPMVASMMGLDAVEIRPGSAGRPVCGYDIRILQPPERELAAGEEGIIAVKLPLPPGCFPNLWHNTPRFRKAYLEECPGYYVSGDGGHLDADGYVYITGRVDDVINVAGHRLSTTEMEEVVAGHPAVAECAVVGVEDQLKGQVPLGFIVFRSGVSEDPLQVRRAVQELVREKMGHIAALRDVVIAEGLPKTRSGKILRRTLRDVASGRETPIPATIEDPSVIERLKRAL